MKILLLGGQFREAVVHVRTVLEKRGHTVLLTKEDKEPATKDEKRKFVEKLQKLIEDADALLVLNYENTLSPSMLLGVSAAFYFDKSVYVYREFPVAQRSDFLSFGAIELRGDLTKHF